MWPSSYPREKLMITCIFFTPFFMDKKQSFYCQVRTLKRNIGLFSGFVWFENEEKQRAKIKEKLNKCVKEKLLDFCDVLNIPVLKFSVKKEELCAKLLKFLESPHATTDILLADKEKTKKRKRNAQSSKSPCSSNFTGGKHTKKHRLDSEKEWHDDKSEASQSEDSGAESDEKGSDSEMETDEDQAKPEIVVKGSGSGKSTKDSETKGKKKAPTKKQKTEKDSKVDTTSPPAKVKGSSKALKTDEGEAKSSNKAKEEPSEEEMQAVVENILKEADFNTATLSDILKQLGEHFGVELMHRKAQVRDIITEVIKNMSDEDDGEASSSSESGDDE